MSEPTACTWCYGTGEDASGWNSCADCDGTGTAVAPEPPTWLERAIVATVLSVVSLIAWVLT